MFRLELWSAFSDEWLVTRRAAKLFFLATLLIPSMTVQGFGWVDFTHWAAWEKTIYGVLAMAGVAACFFLWYGMRCYWARLDDSRAFVKRVWFPFVLFGPWGSCLYCYCVYLPQVLRKWKAEG
jgi:hypothetical protein